MERQQIAIMRLKDVILVIRRMGIMNVPGNV